MIALIKIRLRMYIFNFLTVILKLFLGIGHPAISENCY